MADIKKLQDIATQVRRDILRMTHNATCGHPGGSLGCADLLTALYFHKMNINLDFQMDGKNEDLFFLSNGHISPLWYSILSRRGYFPTDELGTFRMLNSRLQGHPATEEKLPGIRIASGSLGQGLSVASGAALTKKYNDDNSLIYVLTGDGELQEGQNWEALMFAAHNKLDNMVLFVDDNNAQIDGNLDEVLDLIDIKAKLLAFGWDTLEMDGNNMEDIVQKLELITSRTGKSKPVAVVMKTKMGAGVDFMANAGNKWHGVAPNDEQLEAALKQLPITLGDY